MSSFGDRLREERKALGKTQDELAAIAGVTRNPYAAWEKSATAPDARQLASLVTVGVDVLYVLTGERGGTVLTARETAMLGTYRALSAKEQEAAQTLLDAAAQSGEVKKDKAA